MYSRTRRSPVRSAAASSNRECGTEAGEGPDNKVRYPVPGPAPAAAYGQRVTGAAPRAAAVAAAAEDPLRFFLRQHRRRSLRHPVSRIGHAGQTHALPVIFRYPRAPHRTREIAPRAHPVPQLAQVVLPVPRPGTLPPAARAARGPPPRGQPGWLAFRSRPPLPGRQVLLFRASARDELTPPLHRAPPGQHAGHPLAEGTPARAVAPEALHPPGFDATVPPADASAAVHARPSSRRTPDPLTAGPSPQRSPPRL